MGGQDRTTALVIERFAAAQHGNVARAQLLDAGVTPRMIERRVASGLLLPRYRGVYRVGHRAPSILADYMGGVLACGDASLLYGLAATHLLRLIKWSPSAPHVLTATERRIEGVVTRRCRDIAAVGRTEVRNIPVVTVPEAIVSVAGVLPDEALARVCHEAGVLYRTTPADIERVLNRYPSVTGAGTLRAIMTGDIKVSLSKLEREFLRLLLENHLPLPQTNRPAGAHRVDCRWPKHGVTVELDGYRFHNSLYSWKQDRIREREARARGDEFRRYDWQDVFNEPAAMLGELRELLL